MGMKRLRPGMPSFAARVGALASGAAADHDANGVHERDSGGMHGHAQAHEHAHGGHGAHPATGRPQPRPRRAATSRAARSRRRRGASATEEDEIDFPDGEESCGVAAIGAGGDARDGGDDQGEGGDERSRHERLGLIRQHEDEQAGTAWRLPRSAAGAGRRQAARRFVAAACRLVAEWQSGAAVADRLRVEKLALLKMLDASPGRLRLDAGGLARVRELLLRHAPAAGRDPNMNLMLPLLLLNLQRLYTPDQLDQAIARLALPCKGRPR